MRIAFGRYELDDERRLLLREGVAVPVAPKPLALLELLIRRRPSAVSKEELVAELWQSAAISDTALTTVVNELRGVLGESGREPRFVRTSHGFGYAFEGEARPVVDAAAPTRGWLVGVGIQIRLADGETTLGRAPGEVGTIPDASVSRRHARVRASVDAVTIEDLDSRNGTFVRGEPAEGVVRLEDGDALTIGLVHLRYVAGDLDPKAATPSFGTRPRPK